MSECEDWVERDQLAKHGEPCGGFLHQCRNIAAHMRYFNLSERQKYLMVLEREYLCE